MTEKRKSLIKQIWKALENGKKKMRWGTICVNRTPDLKSVDSCAYVGHRMLVSYSTNSSIEPIFYVWGNECEYKTFKELNEEAIEYVSQNIDRLKANISERADNSWKASESWKRCKRAAQKEEKRYNRILI